MTLKIPSHNHGQSRFPRSLDEAGWRSGQWSDESGPSGFGVIIWLALAVCGLWIAFVLGAAFL